MRSRIQIGAVLAALLVLPTLGCDEAPPPTAPTIIISDVGNPVININPGPAPNTPSPAPSTQPGSPAIDGLKITVIGGENLNPPRTFKVGQSYRLTVSPQAGNLGDPCKTLTPCPYYGEQDIAWIGGQGTANAGTPAAQTSVVVILGLGSDTRYNLDFKAQAPGTFVIEAAFRGSVKAEPFVGTVLP